MAFRNGFVTSKDIAYKTPGCGMCRHCKKEMAGRALGLRRLKARNSRQPSAARFCSDFCFTESLRITREGAKQRIESFLLRKK